MSLMRWDPFFDFESFFDKYNRLKKGQLKKGNERETITEADWVPAVDVSETEHEYLIKAEIPEVDKKNVKVSVNDGMLTIQGHRKHETEDKDKKFHRMERSYGSFMRSFSVPDDVDDQNIEAEYKDGVLNLVLKKTQSKQPKAIEVKVN